MIHVLGFVLVLIIGYCAIALIKPKRRCGRCNGWGAVERKPCPKCQATGIRFRFGAVMLHRAVVAAVKYVREQRWEKS